jgi:hypothetical protein
MPSVYSRIKSVGKSSLSPLSLRAIRPAKLSNHHREIRSIDNVIFRIEITLAAAAVSSAEIGGKDCQVIVVHNSVRLKVTLEALLYE